MTLPSNILPGNAFSVMRAVAPGLAMAKRHFRRFGDHPNVGQIGEAIERLAFFRLHAGDDRLFDHRAVLRRGPNDVTPGFAAFGSSVRSRAWELRRVSSRARADAAERSFVRA